MYSREHVGPALAVVLVLDEDGHDEVDHLREVALLVRPLQVDLLTRPAELAHERLGVRARERDALELGLVGALDVGEVEVVEVRVVAQRMSSSCDALVLGLVLGRLLERPREELPDDALR